MLNKPGLLTKNSLMKKDIFLISFFLKNPVFVDVQDMNISTS